MLVGQIALHWSTGAEAVKLSSTSVVAMSNSSVLVRNSATVGLTTGLVVGCIGLYIFAIWSAKQCMKKDPPLYVGMTPWQPLSRPLTASPANSPTHRDGMRKLEAMKQKPLSECLRLMGTCVDCHGMAWVKVTDGFQCKGTAGHFISEKQITF